MLIFVISAVIIVITILFGVVLAFGVAKLDTAVKDTFAEIENKEKGFNIGMTFGHRITVQADLQTQLKEARKVAARKAASMARGANMGIGRLGSSNLKTAANNLSDDPQSAVRIAAFHGWDGARTGLVVAAPTASAAAPAAAVAVGGKVELVPGRDYEVIEITDGMSPDEKRKARIANAKAKSAATKAAKSSAEVGAVAPVVPATAASMAVATPATAPVAVDLPEAPVLIDITDDMPPDEKRKARIANSKAKSAYNKALKAAGLDPKAVAAGAPATPVAPVAEATPAAAIPPEPTAAEAAAPVMDPASSIPEPDYIEITDGMEPDEVRKARIHNAKARSAYNKALKAAGIDPKTVGK